MADKSEPAFKVVSRRSVTYLDKGGEPVSGFAIRVEVPEFNEIWSFTVPSLDPDVVKETVNKAIKDAQALAG